MRKLKLFTLAVTITFFTACTTEKKIEENKTNDSAEIKKEEPEVKEIEETKAEEDTIKVDMSSKEAKILAKNWAMTAFTHTDGRKQDNITNASIELKEDGTFDEKFKGQSIATGKWMLADNNKNLVLKHLTGNMKDKIEKLGIKELKDDKLVTVDDDGKMTETYIPAAKK